MIEHVFRRASNADGLDRVVVLTDDERVAAVVAEFGGECEMTPGDCASGTDRIAWAARDWKVAAVINIQGDEPLIDPADIQKVAERLRAHPEDAIVTLAAPAEPGDAEDPNVVKVVCDVDGNALYFSRSAIPHRRGGGESPALRHLGIYGYQRDALLALAELEPTPLEQEEKLEQLRALENGWKIRVLKTNSAFVGVDTREDLERAELLLTTGQNLNDRPETGSRGE